MAGRRRYFSTKFKEKIVRRLVQGESVRAVCREFSLDQSNVYRWREKYHREGMERQETGQRGSELAQEAVRQRMAALERKIGQQALDIDFLQRAFKRVKESQRQSSGSGVTASTRKSDA
jgi:transposase-like protein